MARPEYREKQHRIRSGKKNSPESNAKRSSTLTGIKRSPEQRERYRMANLRPGPPDELCEICKRPSLRGNLKKDHDHVTGKSRGRLCNNCNLGLGLFRDSPELLRVAAGYVEEYRDAS